MASTADRDDYEWREVSPGKWERELSHIEKYLLAFAVASRRFPNATAVLTLIVDYQTQQPDFLDKLKQAWHHVLAKHPTAASELVGTKRVYDSGSMDEKNEKAFVIERDRTLHEAFANLGQVYRTWLHVFPASQQLMIVCGHDQVDTRGQLLFADSLFHTLAVLEQDKPLESPSTPLQERLAPSFEVIIKPQLTPAAIERGNEMFGDFFKYSGGLETRRMGDLPPGNATWQGVQFSETETKAVLEAVRARGTTVTPAIHVAAVVAARDITGSKEPYSGIIPSDQRYRCGRHAKEPITIYLGGPTIVIPHGSFNEVLDGVAKDYKTLRKEHASGSLTALEKSTWDAVGGQEDPQPVESSAVMVTNPGNFDLFVQHSYGSLEVKGLNTALVEQFYLPFFMFHSFRGRFRASLTYNDKYYAREAIQDYCRRVKTTLLQGLGVEQDLDALEDL